MSSGIPQRYLDLGFTKVGEQMRSTRLGKKWMVLAKKGDKYKVVHGGYKGMQDYTQHHDEQRRENFWSRMGGINSKKTKDPFSPLYWHKKFGTWELGGELKNIETNMADNKIKKMYYGTNSANGSPVSYEGVGMGVALYNSGSQAAELSDSTNNVAVKFDTSNSVKTNTSEWDKVVKLAIELADKDYAKRKGLTSLPEDQDYYRYDSKDSNNYYEISSSFITKAARDLGYNSIIVDDAAENFVVVFDKNDLIKTNEKHTMARGGEIHKDLFEDYENMPAPLSAIWEKYEDRYMNGDMTYDDTKKFKSEVEEIGYTFDFGLDNEPMALRPIGVPLNQVEGFEDDEETQAFANGGFVGVRDWKTYRKNEWNSKLIEDLYKEYYGWDISEGKVTSDGDLKIIIDHYGATHNQGNEVFEQIKDLMEHSGWKFEKQYAQGGGLGAHGISKYWVSYVNELKPGRKHEAFFTDSKDEAIKFAESIKRGYSKVSDNRDNGYNSFAWYIDGIPTYEQDYNDTIPKNYTQGGELNQNNMTIQTFLGGLHQEQLPPAAAAYLRDNILSDPDLALLGDSDYEGLTELKSLIETKFPTAITGEVELTLQDLRDALEGAKATVEFLDGQEKQDMQDYIDGLEVTVEAMGYEQGGKIPNNYKGKDAETLWDSWSKAQREHFIQDHLDVIITKWNAENSNTEIIPMQWSTVIYGSLPDAIRATVIEHKNEGQYDNGGHLAKGGFVGKGELVWKRLNGAERLDFIVKNFTPEITPRSQEDISKKAYNFLPKKIKDALNAHYANVE